MNYLLDGMKCSSMTTDTSSDNDQIVIERLWRAPIISERSWNTFWKSRSVKLKSSPRERRESQGLSSQTTETEIYRLRGSKRKRIEGVIWSWNCSGVREGEWKWGLHFGFWGEMREFRWMRGDLRLRQCMSFRGF